MSENGPWNLTVDTGHPVSPTGFEYSIYVPDEAPLSFKLLGATSASGPWQAVYSTAAAPSGGCPAPPPPAPIPPYYADPAIRAVNMSTNNKSWALGFATHPSATHPGRTDFALCYNEKHDGNAALAW